MVPNTWLTLDSPLSPFKKNDGGGDRPYTSTDCIHIEKQLGYTYGPGSLEQKPIALAAAVVPGASSKMIRVSGINRASIRGSFLISAYINIGGKKYHVGTEAVLSRWNVQYCANCQTHLEAKAFIGLHAFQQDSIENAEYEIQIRTRDGMLNHPQTSPSPLSVMSKKSFQMEIR
jgi:tyrosinase